MIHYDLQINGADHLVAKRSGSTPERQKKNTEKDRSETTALQMESPPKENPCTLPTTRQRSRKKNHAESSSEGGLFGVVGSSTHDGVPGVRVAEIDMF